MLSHLVVKVNKSSYSRPGEYSLTHRVYCPCRFCRFCFVSYSSLVLLCYIRIATCVACTCRYGSPSSSELRRLSNEYSIFV